MVAERQQQLLALLHALGGRVRNLDFQKLLFLYCQLPVLEGTYEFVPYRFGAFSFTSYFDRRKLIEAGLLLDDDRYWQITDAGRGIVSEKRTPASTFAQLHRSLRGDALVAETYRRHPYYAIRSEAAERLLAGDPHTLARVEAARPKPKADLSTIGYEGQTLEGYLNCLLRAGVTLLCDVRRNPVSRKYGFSKSTLMNACEKLGIRYEHLPELGIESEKRCSLETQADYDALFAEYRRDYLPTQSAAIARIVDWIHEGHSVALTCYERLPAQCHRHCVAAAVEKNLGPGSSARHL